ncbi:hypothetical protein JCM8547_001706 [Rhodosporidiobolus lusitaniae]
MFLAPLPEIVVPESPPRSPAPSNRPPRVLLAAFSLDRNIRRAALDIVQRLTGKERAARKRARLSTGSLPSEDDEASCKPAGRKIDLHVLLLPTSNSLEPDAEDDDVLEELHAAGVKVSVHPLLVGETSRLVFSSSNPGRIALLQALCSDGPFHSLLLDELSAAGFVFGSHEPEGDEAAKTFIELLARNAETAFPTGRAPPSVTLYVAADQTSSNFDLDLPEEQVLSLRVLHSAADLFRSSSPSPTSPPARRSRMSWMPDRPKNPPKSLHSRRASGTPLPSFLSPTPSPPSLRPLVLRPAPGPIQSVSLRLSLDTADVLLRVAETLTPVDSGGRKFDPRLPPSTPSPSPSSFPSPALTSRSSSPPSLPEILFDSSLDSSCTSHPPSPPPSPPRRSAPFRHQPKSSSAPPTSPISTSSAAVAAVKGKKPRPTTTIFVKKMDAAPWIKQLHPSPVPRPPRRDSVKTTASSASSRAPKKPSPPAPSKPAKNPSRTSTTSSSYTSTVFVPGRHSALTKQPGALQRSDTVLTTASSEFEVNEKMNALRELLDERRERARKAAAAGGREAGVAVR